MAAKNKVLVDGVQLTTSSSVLYTSPSIGEGTRIVALSLTNTSGVNASFDLHIVESGGGVSTANKIISSQVLSANEDDSPIATQNQLIPPGGTLRGLASDNATIGVRASGIEFT